MEGGKETGRQGGRVRGKQAGMQVGRERGRQAGRQSIFGLVGAHPGERAQEKRRKEVAKTGKLSSKLVDMKVVEREVELGRRCK